MTTFATNEHAQPALDERQCAAWSRYADTLRTLGPAAYAAAEPPAWEHLQEELAEIDAAPSPGVADVPAV